jgi:hypothetical protein
MDQASTTTMMRATGTYEIKNWDEKTWEGKDRQEQSGPKLTHAKITQTFEGDIEGEATVQFLMTYRDDTFASYVGLMVIVGRIGRRKGSFVFEVKGLYESGMARSVWTVVPGSGTDELHGLRARSVWTVVPGSGTDELHGLRGEGESVAEHGSKQPYTFHYFLEWE